MAIHILATGQIYGGDFSVSPIQVMVTVSYCAPDVVDAPHGGAFNTSFDVGALAVTTQTNYKNAVVAGVNDQLGTSYDASEVQIIGGGII